MIRGKISPIPQKAGLISPRLKMDVNINIHNRFDIEVIDALTGQIKQRAQAFNVICSTFWKPCLSGSNILDRIAFGTGSGTPSTSDTKLFSPLGYKYQLSTLYNSKLNQIEKTAQITIGIQLLETEYVGQTITEVGIGSTSTIYTHAMLQDMNGNPLALLKSDTDIVNIYATVYVHYGSLDTSKFILCRAATDKYIPRLIGQCLGLASIKTYSFTPGSPTEDVGTVSRSYNEAEKKITFTTSRLAASARNQQKGSGFQHIVLGSDYYSNSQSWAFDALMLETGSEWYPQSKIVGEALGTSDGETTDFLTQFGSISNTIVYVDGNPQTEVEIDSELFIPPNPEFYYNKDSTAVWICIHPESTVENIMLLNGVDSYGGFTSDAGGYGKATTVLSTISKNKSFSFVSDYYLFNLSDIQRAQNGGIYYNPDYKSVYPEYIGMTKTTNPDSQWETAKVTIETSDDLLKWTPIEPVTAWEINAVSGQNYNYAKIKPLKNKYLKISVSGRLPQSMFLICPGRTNPTNIHFLNPPPAGSVITVDYTTPVIAKDENHVFDFELTMTLNEKTDL